MELEHIFTSAFIITWLAASVRLAGPVLLAALGEIFDELAGILNVGIEGTILLGALRRRGTPAAPLRLSDPGGVAEPGNPGSMGVPAGHLCQQ